MGTYTVQESVRRGRIETVESYGDLEHHHPSRNLAEHNRIYADIDGRSEEILKERGTKEPRLSAAGDYFVSKDFILTADGRGNVPVPSPATGYAGAYNETMGSVELWNVPEGEPDRVMIARILHMDPDTFQHKPGDRIEYGESLGTQAGRGVDKQGVVRDDAYGIHVHIDINTRYIGQFDRYLRDLNAGVIRTETRPEQSENVVGPASVVTNVRDHEGRPIGPVDPLADGVLARGDRGDVVGALQNQLRTLGYTNPRGELLVVDRDFGGGTEHAVRQFQTDRGLPATGVANNATRSAIDRAVLERGPDPALAPPPVEPTPGVRTTRPDESSRLHDVQFDRAREFMRELDQRMGIVSGESTDRVAAALTAEWHAQGARGSIDGVVLGQKGAKAEAGEYVFAYSGSSERPSDWVGVRTAEAVRTPVEDSLTKAETLQRQQAVEAQQYAQTQQQANDAPARSMS